LSAVADFFILGNMPKTKEQKKEIIKDLKEKITKQKSIVLVDFTGLSSKPLFHLREELKDSNCLFQVIKKTLLFKVLEEGGNKLPFIENIKKVKGQLALIFGFQDEILPAKIAYQNSLKNEKLRILGGVFENNFLTIEKVVELAQLPTKEELFGKLAGSLQNTISSFVNLLKFNLKGLIYTLNSIKK